MLTYKTLRSHISPAVSWHLVVHQEENMIKAWSKSQNHEAWFSLFTFSEDEAFPSSGEVHGMHCIPYSNSHNDSVSNFQYPSTFNNWKHVTLNSNFQRQNKIRWLPGRPLSFKPCDLWPHLGQIWIHQAHDIGPIFWHWCFGLLNLHLEWGICHTWLVHFGGAQLLKNSF